MLSKTDRPEKGRSKFGWLLKNMQLNKKTRVVDTPAEQILDCLEGICQQNSENG
jgi:hypothetical protein